MFFFEGREVLTVEQFYLRVIYLLSLIVFSLSEKQKIQGKFDQNRKITKYQILKKIERKKNEKLYVCVCV
jgi:hypothetical protein